MNNNKKSIHSIVKVLWIFTGIAAAIVFIISAYRLSEYEDTHRKEFIEAVNEAQQAAQQGEEVPSGEQRSDIPAPSATPSATPTPTEIPVPYQEDVIDPAKKMVALSFDDGPSELATERILKTLAKHNVHATFFMVGYNVDRLPDIVKKVYDAGQEIANHTLDHTDLSKSDVSTIVKQVSGNKEKINALVPVGDILLRPPYGSYNDDCRDNVGAPMICWSVDSEDWSSKDCDTIVKKVMHDVQDGYIILLHDLYSSTADAVEVFIPKLIEEGYQIVSVSELFEIRGEELKNGHVYRMTSPAPTP